MRARLRWLSDWLDPRSWLEGRFTVGDLMTSAVLRNLRHTDLLADTTNLAAYRARCEWRAAFERALAASLAAFDTHSASAVARPSPQGRPAPTPTITRGETR